MIICPACKKELSDGTKFCKFCGTQIMQTDVQQPSMSNPINEYTKKSKKSSKKVTIAIIAVLLVIAVVLSVIFIPKFINDEKENEDKQTAEEKLTAILEESTSKPIIDFVCEDYDLNGTYEAYAVVGETDEEDAEHPEFYDADIYFVNEKKAQPVKENVSGKTNGIIELEDIKYISIEVYDDGTDEGKSFIYTVDGDESEEHKDSGKYSDVHQENGKIVAEDENGEKIEIDLNDSGENTEEMSEEPTNNNEKHDEETSQIANNIKNASAGDIVEFGSYPQTKVTDSSLITTLDSQSKVWKSYGYYTGSGDRADDEMQSGDYMKYADITYDGNKYRAVTFSQYRPSYTGAASSQDNSYQSENGYVINTTYYFKYEPLKWRVLDPDDGLIMCENIIDSQAYNNTAYFNGSEYYQDSTCTTYANDYATSSIRSWLNEDFYNTAFVSSEKNAIQHTVLDNECPWTSEYSSTTTQDKIFLLSYYEAINSAYGFSEIAGDYDTARQASGTDYAACQGLWISKYTDSSYGYSWWWLRSAYEASDIACGVYGSGFADVDNGVCITSDGVRPALKINM
ncbi:MAG: zinc ribbon domain-containing protein [Ruminococcaceae bacterium]|nr:zinc ribbon domain-containing protein [Oscillospiraceae bacterium]